MAGMRDETTTLEEERVNEVEWRTLCDGVDDGDDDDNDVFVDGFTHDVSCCALGDFERSAFSCLH